MRIFTALFLICLSSFTARAQEARHFDHQIEFRDLTSAEQTAARRAAREKTYDHLTFCADPGNMPLSNNRAEGFQNKIAEAVAAKMGARVRYFWRPFFERGLTRETFDNHECEIIIELPYGYEHVLTSIPIYRSTYVFATHADADFTIDGFDDPDLRQKTLGVFQHSGMREALSRHGIKEGLDLHILSYDADLRPEKQPWNQVQRVADGTLDIAGVWGPFAGWVEARGGPVTLTPANVMEDQVPLEFDMAFGVRTNDVVLKYALDFALLDAQDEIKAILEEFSVPLVQCSACAVSGDLPAHGSYFQNIVVEAQERFTEVHGTAPKIDFDNLTPVQTAALKRLDRALANGADIGAEFANAVTGSDELRVTYLLERGVKIDAPDLQGATPLITAAKSRDTQMLEFLLDKGAGIDVADRDDMTALHHAVLRNHAPSVALLIAKGADASHPSGPGKLPALALAIEMDMRWATKALIEAGVPVDTKFNEANLTPLMLIATRSETRNRSARVTGGPSLVELGTALLAKGADPNAVTSKGVTALMIAAGQENTDILALLLNAGADASLRNAKGRTALDIAEIARATRAAQALRILAQ